MPRRDRDIARWTKRLLRRVPAAQRAIRTGMYLSRELMVFAFREPALMRRLQLLSKHHLARAVPNAALRAKLAPDYTMGCKRVIVSDDYLPALTRPNVEVVTSGVAEVRERSVVDGDGAERTTDVIIFGTGFRPTDPPLAPLVRGRDGRTLADVWSGSPRAHVGTTVSGFPNLFLLLGPNTGLGHSSVVLMEEAQIEHVVRAMAYMRRRGVAAVEPRADAQEAWIAGVERRMAGTVWTAGGCRSWYLDRTGRNSALWPDFTWRFERRVRRFIPAEYVEHNPRSSFRASARNPDVTAA
jgi:cation diffusion facilitator CzcD-associated flavoprotein CzcO